METGHRRDWEGQEGWEAMWEAEAILGTMGWGQGLTTFSWIWLLDTEMLREACPMERGEGRGERWRWVDPGLKNIFTHNSTRV